MLSDVLLVLAALLILAGILLVSVPGALVVGGLILFVFSLGFSDRTKR